MWELANGTPYAAERNWVRDKQGHHWWLVAVKATYDIGAGGRLALADEQVPPVLSPEYFGEAGVSSLRYDSDLLAVKPTTDVLVHGSAYAPKGRPMASVPVTLRVGHVDKRLVVHGNRVYVEGALGLGTTSPIPFTTQPIRYEYAFGGYDRAATDPKKHRLDERNPIGRGFVTRPSHNANKPAHTVEYTSGAPASKGPAGFGPIDPSWIPRRTLAGTYDARWIEHKRPFLPDDYDDLHACCAPADQRLRTPLVGGEQIGLLNMSPDGTLAFQIPRASFEFTSSFGARQERHGHRLATVVVEPDERRVFVVWQSALRVPASQIDYLDQTRVSLVTSPT